MIISQTDAHRNIVATLQCQRCGARWTPEVHGDRCPVCGYKPVEQPSYSVRISRAYEDGDRAYYVSVEGDHGLTVLNAELLTREEARALARRAHKATALVGHTRQMADGRWQVESQSHLGHWYTVNDSGCQCADKSHGASMCKHEVVVKLSASRHQVEDFDALLEEARRNPLSHYSAADWEQMDAELAGYYETRVW
jgi:ribosomal protein L37E